jgi:hypothetical protein
VDFMDHEKVSTSAFGLGSPVAFAAASRNNSLGERL